MIFLKARNTSIATRMLALAILPVLLMSGFILIWSYYSRSEEIRKDLNDRGEYLAEAIAESSQYGVISGNTDDINKVIQRFLAFDKSIDRIEVFDRDKNSLALISRNSFYTSEKQVSGAEIRNVPLDIGVLFVERNAPHVTSKDYASPTNHGSIASSPASEVIGYVKVTMSPENLLSSKRSRLLLGLAISVTCLLASVLFGLLLARGFTEPLSTMIATLRRIRSGDYDVKLDGVVAGNEIQELQVTIVEMAKSFAELTKNLEEKVIDRTRDLQVARDNAINSDAEKRRLLYKVNSVVEEERKNIAIEIHDHLNSSLIVAKLESKRILTLLAGQPKCQVIEEVIERANSIVRLTSELYEITRDIVKRVRPEISIELNSYDK